MARPRIITGTLGGSIVFFVTIVLALVALALFSWRRAGDRPEGSPLSPNKSDT